MNKEEILAKSRKENVLQDEMERTVRIEGESFSLILVFLVGVVIVIFNRLHGLPANSVLAMFWASCVGNRLYRLTKRRNAADLSCFFGLESGKILHTGMVRTWMNSWS